MYLSCLQLCFFVDMTFIANCYKLYLLYVTISSLLFPPLCEKRYLPTKHNFSGSLNNFKVGSGPLRFTHQHICRSFKVSPRLPFWSTLGEVVAGDFMTHGSVSSTWCYINISQETSPASSTHLWIQEATWCTCAKQAAAHESLCHDKRISRDSATRFFVTSATVDVMPTNHPPTPG